MIGRGKGPLMEREQLDEQEAFTHLRRAARSSGRRLTEVAAEVAAGLPLPRGQTARSLEAPSRVMVASVSREGSNANCPDLSLMPSSGHSGH
jgi:ANTAR domain